MRIRARNTPATKSAEEVEQSYHGKVPPGPPHKRRGRGRPRVDVAEEVEQEQPPVDQKAPEVDPAAFAASMAGINQGLTALNQAMSLVQKMLQQRNYGMIDADAALLYSRVGRITFDGFGDALDFINTIETRMRIGYTNYQRIMIVELLVQAATQD